MQEQPKSRGAPDVSNAETGIPVSEQIQRLGGLLAAIRISYARHFPARSCHSPEEGRRVTLGTMRIEDTSSKEG